VHAAEDQWRSETAAARRRYIKRHFVGGERLQPAPQPLKLRGVDASAGAAGIDQPVNGIVVGEQKDAGADGANDRRLSSRSTSSQEPR
jgi:hypothetical protein